VPSSEAESMRAHAHDLYVQTAFREAVRTLPDYKVSAWAEAIMSKDPPRWALNECERLYLLASRRMR
jgi:hypothetical protein